MEIFKSVWFFFDSINNSLFLLLLLLLQAVDDNDEAEQMIRAITHGDIDHSVYSQMADDLENAVQHRKKDNTKPKKKKKVDLF